MSRRRWAWITTIAILVVAAWISAPALAQANEQAATDEETIEFSSEPEVDTAEVERILREQEQMMTGQRFSYDPSGRRDPFRSLFEKVALDERPDGIGGMLVTEIDLVGIVTDRSKGDVAFFSGSDSKGYFLQVGDRVYDGSLIAIDSLGGKVTFRQKVEDPRRIRPYRDVVKRLIPLEEGSGNE